MAESIRNKLDIKEILKFLVGGGSAVVVDAIVYVLLKQHLSIFVSKAISYISGAIVGFIINKFWTFRSKNFRISEIYKYIMLYAISAFVNTLINKVVIFLFNNTVFAFLCATGTSTIINFLGQKFMVFKKDKVNG